MYSMEELRVCRFIIIRTNPLTQLGLKHENGN